MKFTAVLLALATAAMAAPSDVEARGERNSCDGYGKHHNNHHGEHREHRNEQHGEHRVEHYRYDNYNDHRYGKEHGRIDPKYRQRDYYGKHHDNYKNYNNYNDHRYGKDHGHRNVDRYRQRHGHGRHHGKKEYCSNWVPVDKDLIALDIAADICINSNVAGILSVNVDLDVEVDIDLLRQSYPTYKSLYCCPNNQCKKGRKIHRDNCWEHEFDNKYKHGRGRY